MDEEIKIEKGVPIPPHRVPRGTYPFYAMEVGDSFEAENPVKVRNALASVNRTVERRLWRFQTRMTPDKLRVRVWRVA